MSKIITNNLDAEFKQAKRNIRAETEARVMNVLPGRKSSAYIGRTVQSQLSNSGVNMSTMIEPYYNPEIQRPFMEIPKDFAQRVKWRRQYYATEPIVASACELHSLIPFSSFRLEHKDNIIARDFHDMFEDINFDEFLLDLFLEFWVVGDIIPFGFMDDEKDPTRWTGFVMLDPTLVDVEWDPMLKGTRSEILKLKFSDTLKDIVKNGPQDPETGELYESVPTDVKDLIRQEKDMVLTQTQASHIKYFGSYYEKRGRSIIDRALGWLMYRDKLKSAQYAVADRHICYDSETECLTKDGFKKYYELTDDDYIASVNKDTGKLEYQKPEFIYINEYKGDMLHFNKNMDILVTPDHNMLVQKPGKEEWELCHANTVEAGYKFRSVISDTDGEQCQDIIRIGEYNIDIEDFLILAGLYIVNGTVGDKGVLVIYQNKGSDYIDLFNRLGFKKEEYTPEIDAYISTKDNEILSKYFISNFGESASLFTIPSWIKKLSKHYLRIFFNALQNRITYNFGSSKKPDKEFYFAFKECSADIQEILFKLGYNPVIYDTDPLVEVEWSTEEDESHYPVLPENPFQCIQYNGVIWCLGVKNKVFVTRRNGKITIQGNCPREFYKLGSDTFPTDDAQIGAFGDLLESQWNQPNSAIIWHHALQIEWLGASGKVLPLQPEFQYIDKQLFIALLINEGVLTAERQPYASTSIGFDVMLQRYLSMRTKIANWIVHKVCKPMCEIHKIHKITSNEIKHRIRFNRKDEYLDLPTVKWDKEELRNDSQKIQTLISLAEKNIVPWDMVLPLLDLDYDQVKAGMLKQQREGGQKQPSGEDMGGGMPMGLGLPTAPGDMPPLDGDLPDLPGMDGDLGEGLPTAPGGFPPESAEALSEGYEPGV